jgi:hypothetical protein
LEGEWLAVHLHDVGTRAAAFLTAPGDGTRIETDELDMYRIHPRGRRHSRQRSTLQLTDHAVEPSRVVRLRMGSHKPSV